MNSVSKINKIDTYLLIFEKQQKQTKNPTMWYIIQIKCSFCCIDARACGYTKSRP